ncbi:hypothetical protein [Allorhizocola rhizosphaerae]|uniref:hypothetical protein n=1 Tax=Allorhizocola rhizosphaerae TaxID=1872709 RepID=UPI000E3D60A8|nr:hypothetical protein [Allorhizocola rhizosphaerae]
MKQWIRRALTHFAAAVLGVSALTVVSASPAQAFGNETFGCRVSPGTVLTWRNPCTNNRPAATYNAGFNLLNLSGDGYTFSWSISGDVLYIVAGCTSTSSGCGVATPGGSSDGFVHVTVTYSQGGQTASRSATAIIRGYCGGQLC